MCVIGIVYCGLFGILDNWSALWMGWDFLGLVMLIVHWVDKINGASRECCGWKQGRSTQSGYWFYRGLIGYEL